jgi:eukaryotic-like serine/threonine-protein kinase
MNGAAQLEPPWPRLGRYRLLHELGSGGMARVYLAVATGIGGFTKLIVLKVMRDELAADPQAVEMFLGEARLAARMNHPNVVQTTEIGQDAGCYFIGMEYLEGLPLSRLLAQSGGARVPLAERLEILCQMLDGLSYIHGFTDLDGSRLGLVHRDVSPSNVIVTFDGAVKVVDFGVAKAAGLNHVTQHGEFKGKYGYAAPEQFLGESDARSDVFAAGLLAWEVLSYRRLARDRTQAEIIHGRALGADQALMRRRGVTVPAELLEVCLKAASPEPSERYSSAAELRDALRAYMSRHALQSSPEQLRRFLGERFDAEWREARLHIDQRLKQLEPALGVAEGGAAVVPSDAPLTFSAQRRDAVLSAGAGRRGLASVVVAIALASAIGAAVALVPEQGASFAATKATAMGASRPLLGASTRSSDAYALSPVPLASARSFARLVPASAADGSVTSRTKSKPPLLAKGAVRRGPVAPRPSEPEEARAEADVEQPSVPALRPPSVSDAQRTDFVRVQRGAAPRPIESSNPYAQ